MKQCPVCGKEYEDTMAFCAECGAQLTEAQMMFCRNCGEKIRAGVARCPKCGADLGGKKTAAKKKNVPKAALLGGVAVIAAAAIAAGVYGVKQQEGNGEFYYYAKADGWHYYDANKKITGETGFQGSDVGDVPIVSSNGKRVFYCGDGNLYYRDLKKKNEEAILIDNGVIQYAINNSGSEVIYTRSDKTLNKIELPQNEKECLLELDEIEGKLFFMSNDNSKILFLTDSEDKYNGIEYSLFDIKSKEYKTIGKSANYTLGWNDDFSEIWYVTYNSSGSGFSLCKYTESTGGNRAVVSGHKILAAYDKGQIYYTTRVESEKTLWDFVEDDTELNENSDSESQKDRKNLKDKLMSEKVEVYNINYFDGEKTHKIATRYGGLIPRFALETPFAVMKMNAETNKVIKFSELDSTYGISDVFFAIQENVQGYIISKDKVQEYLSDITAYAREWWISDDGKNLVYLKRKDEDNGDDVYLVSNIGQKDMSTGFVCTNDDFISVRDMRFTSKGELLLDVEENETSSLRKYKNGQTQVICEEPYDWLRTSQGEILVQSSDGTLIRYGEEANIIDSGVDGLYCEWERQYLWRGDGLGARFLKQNLEDLRYHEVY